MRKFVLGLAMTAALPGIAPALADDLEKGNFVGDCIQAAASRYEFPAGILVILLDVENGRLGQVSDNNNNTVDIGPMQVNDSWVPKLADHWGATKEATYLALRDEICANIEGGAWILRQALDEANGDFWEGVGLYHSHSGRLKSAYLRSVYEHALKLEAKASAGDLVDQRSLK